MKEPVDFTSDTEDIKSCCAQLYEQDFVRLLLGDSFHPGGLGLTTQLGQALVFKPGLRVLDGASGTGTSALHLAETFECEVVGVDYGGDNVRVANEAATARGLSGRVRFQQGDSERLPFEDASFDAIICECAFCTFPDKARAGPSSIVYYGPEAASVSVTSHAAKRCRKRCNR